MVRGAHLATNKGVGDSINSENRLMKVELEKLKSVLILENRAENVSVLPQIKLLKMTGLTKGRFGEGDKMVVFEHLVVLQMLHVAILSPLRRHWNSVRSQMFQNVGQFAALLQIRFQKSTNRHLNNLKIERFQR